MGPRPLGQSHRILVNAEPGGVVTRSAVALAPKQIHRRYGTVENYRKPRARRAENRIVARKRA
jgi:hypothetical protein